jgi:hypothetical protein
MGMFGADLQGSSDHARPSLAIRRRPAPTATVNRCDWAALPYRQLTPSNCRTISTRRHLGHVLLAFGSALESAGGLAPTELRSNSLGRRFSTRIRTPVRAVRSS